MSDADDRLHPRGRFAARNVAREMDVWRPAIDGTGMTKGFVLVATAVLAGCSADDGSPVSEVVSAIDVDAFELPVLDPLDRASVVHLYDAIDPADEVPRGLLEDALVYFDHNRSLIPNASHIAVVDMSLYSGLDRFWLIEMETGAVEAHKVAHGDGSDPDNDGYATEFSNISGSHMTSLGFYLGGEIYDGTHPHSMRLDGLSRDGSPNGMANTNARDRLIVMHEADYVDDSRTTQQGRSNGCLALDPDIEAGVADRLTGGALIYTATAPLVEPVGRARCGDGLCDGGEDATSCVADCGEPDIDEPVPAPVDEDGTTGGCAAGGHGGMLLALAAFGVRRRRRAQARAF